VMLLELADRTPRWTPEDATCTGGLAHSITPLEVVLVRPAWETCCMLCMFGQIDGQES
jgi:hypothetical protein